MDELPPFARYSNVESLVGPSSAYQLAQIEEREIETEGAGPIEQDGAAEIEGNAELEVGFAGSQISLSSEREIHNLTQAHRPAATHPNSTNVVPKAPRWSMLEARIFDRLPPRVQERLELHLEQEQAAVQSRGQAAAVMPASSTGPASCSAAAGPSNVHLINPV